MNGELPLGIALSRGRIATVLNRLYNLFAAQTRQAGTQGVYVQIRNDGRYRRAEDFIWDEVNIALSTGEQE